MKNALRLIFLVLIGLASCKNDPPANTENPPTPDILPDSIELEEAPQPYFIKKYEGTIDGKLPIEMVLVNWGDGFLSGRYWYKSKGQPIELSGELTEEAGFQIIEFSKGKETGIFSGTLDDPSRLTGAWSNSGRTRNLPFELFETPPPDDAAGWSGNWHLNAVWDSGTLMIGNVSRDSFDFALTIVRSSHVGTIEGRAAVSDGKARFSRKEFEEEPCILLFKNMGEFIEVEQPSSNFSCGFGARAYAAGKYERKNLIIHAKLSAGNGEAAVFPTLKLHDDFKNLVGPENYELFAFNMQQFQKETTPQKQTIVTGAVPGLYRTNEAIIVFDEKGMLWAATLDVDEVTNETLLRYFTNDPASKKKIIPAIEDWRDSFKDYRVIFQG